MFYLVRTLLFLFEYFILYVAFSSFLTKKEKKFDIVLTIGLIFLTVIDMLPIGPQLINIVSRVLVTLFIALAFYNGKFRNKLYLSLVISFAALMIETVIGLASAFVIGVDAVKLNNFSGLVVIALSLSSFIQFTIAYTIKSKIKEVEKQERNIHFKWILVPVLSFISTVVLGYYFLTAGTENYTAYYMTIALLILMNIFNYFLYDNQIKMVSEDVL